MTVSTRHPHRRSKTGKGSAILRSGEGTPRMVPPTKPRRHPEQTIETRAERPLTPRQVAVLASLPAQSITAAGVAHKLQLTTRQASNALYGLSARGYVRPDTRGGWVRVSR